ncbi:hypothetical protein TVAG_443650 [Trichomonas vaginalis G3]|uniref:Outer dense fiber protein 3 n=1 Tax=Trichomonas vaginalis (strain ATCC PRA-98 / G3) TaxID=412133 RepID=A2ETY9_TRIV3|nr:sperm-tail PG-rich repeat-containing protein [Trichomonas vaginalis G3]EAY03877.1 hypothetical protein TVAG_443650 [Trichomonas vaginalis G3]KAI5552953.1 sperm-tail PG-rich repeat-containing protein [Trichomonas vaginalis G3]|eukprot:XP_001316100.1 hypothetical protein [Trichomonas vaginalis G3]
MKAFDRDPLIAHVSKRQATSPGPAAYDISKRLETTPIKMKGRRTEKVVYDDVRLLNIPSTIGKVPKITISGRTTGITDKFVTPGPTYVPPPFGSGSRHHQFGTHNGIKARPKTAMDTVQTPGPGPAAFNTRDHTFDATGKKGIKMKGTHDFKYAETASPGPGAYAPRFESVLAAAPKPIMHIRPKTKDPEPGVGYKELGSTLTGPAFTMKRRATDDINLV